MKKNIKDYIGTKTAIWIDAHTIEQENAIKDLLLAEGRITRWASGSELKEISYLSEYKKNKGYFFSIKNEYLLVFLKHDTSTKDYQIIPASEFLQPEFVYGEEIEVSNSEDFKRKKIRKYMITAPNGNIITWNEILNQAINWNYARKINHERTEAISTIEELMQKFNISKDEIG